jgi:hypothetical protein
MTSSNYNLPSGWSLVRTQGFENGCGSGESCGGYNGGITTTKPHSGSKSIGGTYNSDQSDVHWELAEGFTGSFTELYVSFYEYIESQALFNDEFFLTRFRKTWSNGDTYQIFMDWYWSPGFNGTEATLYAVIEGTHANDGRPVGKTSTVPRGAWVQWEIHWRPNTPGNSDGFIRVYSNGTLYLSNENLNSNNSIDVSDVMVRVGGIYTKLVWMTDYPTCSQCSSYPGVGTDACTASQGWWGQSFSNPKCNPTDPPLSSFKRYLDDIIILKR